MNMIFQKKGFVLPLVVFLTVIFLAAITFWVKQSLLKSFLSLRLIEQRATYIECRSLIPAITARLDQLPPEKLREDTPAFFSVSYNGAARWEIDRSKLEDNRIILTFHRQEDGAEPIQLVTDYYRP